MATPTSTVANLTALILSWVDDVNAGYFSASETLRWLNFAQREVQKQLILAGENWYVVAAETLTVVGQSDYVLPSDFLKEHRLELVTSGTGVNEVRQPLTEITLNQQDFVPIGLGTPSNYVIKKDRFTITPAPDTANQIIRLYYSYKIAELTSTNDIPDIPEEFMEYAALLATKNAFIKDDRAMTNLLEKIKPYEVRLKQMADSRTQDRSRQIVITDPDYFIGWF